jgi:hypothetical protein
MSNENPVSGYKRVAGKECGSCSLCCKLFDVPPVNNKPAGKWCPNCTPGRGCAIWETRPAFCTDYFCHWHVDASLGPEWRPDTAKFILSREPGGIWLSVVVDMGQPHAWKREPYHSMLRQLAERLIETGTNGLMLIEGDRKSVILPDREVLIGTKLTHTNISFTKSQGAGGARYDVVFNQVPVVPDGATGPGVAQV